MENRTETTTAQYGDSDTGRGDIRRSCGAQHVKTKRPIGGTLKDWQGWYESETGHKLVPFVEHEFGLYDSQHGFLTYLYGFDDKTLFVHYVCGDMKFWADIILTLARSVNFQKILGYTRHNPRLLERLFRPWGLPCKYLTETEHDPDGEFYKFEVMLNGQQ